MTRHRVSLLFVGEDWAKTETEVGLCWAVTVTSSKTFVRTVCLFVIQCITVDRTFSTFMIDKRIQKH